MALLPSEPGSADDAWQTATEARQRKAPWVVVDGYHFSDEYQGRLKEAGLHVLAVDDYGHASHYRADLVLNQNIYADESLYLHREAYTRLMLGPRFILLRREFWRWRGWQRRGVAVARKVLVTLGGADPDNVTHKVIRALQKTGSAALEAVVVVGGISPHFQALQSAASDSSVPICVVRDIRDMPSLMAWADMAVTAGGSTCWELAFMGLPGLVLALADNQRAVAQSMEAQGLGINVGWHQDISLVHLAESLDGLGQDVSLRTEMSRRGQALVDGNGGTRVVSYMRNELLQLRGVRAEDCRLVWDWANDPETRASSFSQEPIPWESHVRWFKARLNDPATVYNVALDDRGEPIGQVRYELRSDEATISISIDRKFRGCGYGSVLIRRASVDLFTQSRVRLIHAFVKPDNVPSIRAFLNAGFTQIEDATINDRSALHFVKRRGQQ